MQDLDREPVSRPEPVRGHRIELRHFSGGERVLVVAQQQPEGAGEHVDPRVSLVTRETRFARTQHMLEDLHASGIVGQRNHDTPGGERSRLEVDATVAALRGAHDVVEREFVQTRQWDQKVERGLAPPGLQPGQRAEREPRPFRERGERESARASDATQARADRADQTVEFSFHTSFLQNLQMACTRARCLVDDGDMNILLLGARGAVGRVIQRVLTADGHAVTAAGRNAAGDAGADLRHDLDPLRRLAATHDVIINASGIERPELAEAAGTTPFVDITATGSYLDALRARAAGTLVIGVGLVPGLSTMLIGALDAAPDDEIDLFVMLGSGEHHGPAAVDWTAGLVGTDLHRPPEGTPVRNLRETRLATGPDGRQRRYLRADFPDHLLGPHASGDALAPPRRVRSFLTLSSATLTRSLRVIGLIPALRGVLRLAPAVGSEAWHLVARHRRTGQRLAAAGLGQSEATGRLAALTAVRAAQAGPSGVVTMHDLLRLDEALTALQP